MIERTVTVEIDRAACIGCDACRQVCPSDTLSLIDGTAAVTGDQSLNCGHCAAVCPGEAIVVRALANDALHFETFRHKPDWMAPGAFPVDELVRLMRSRRSCRTYKRQSVPRAMLMDLVKIGQTAPSGSNCQAWTFTVLPTREAVKRLTGEVGAFYQKLNRRAENGLLRRALKWMGRPELEFYYRNYYAAVREGLEAWQRGGRDRLFHRAPAAILVGARPGAACPQEDALLATQNILLGAHAMGLGTCLIGFAVSAMAHEPRLKTFLGIPRGEAIYAVIAVGFADERYERLPGRKKTPVRLWPGD